MVDIYGLDDSLPASGIRWSVFSLATADYHHDRRTAKMLNALWGEGMTVEQAVAYIRERGAVTLIEKRSAYQARLDGWRAARDAQNTLTLTQFQTRIRAALMKELAKLEPKKMTEDCAVAFEALKRQVLNF